jgi:hypothetical protein
VREGVAGFLLFDQYKYHILVFLIALFIALTFAHPQMLLTDEWVTANQLAQINKGHQVIINEGRYGVYDGILVEYLKAKNNLLSYSLFLPLISFPALLIVDILGNQFSYGILILWALLPISIGIVIKSFMKDPKILGKWRLSSTLFILSFILFVINLYFYIPFAVVGKYSYPEIEAIVFTNIFCYAILAVLIYDILFEIFNDFHYSLFGTAVCLSSSSYLIWSTCTKDHILVAMLYASLLCSIVYYYRKRDRWFFPISCLLTGLIAWTRPELALPTFFGTVAFYWFTYSSIISRLNDLKEWFFIICSPLFVLIGALPFFINNYFVTKNPFLPTATYYVIGNMPIVVSDTATSGLLGSGLINTIEKITQIFISELSIHPDTFFYDLYGVLFNPQSGSMGVFALTPLFLIALFLLPIIIITENHPFSKEERFLLFSMVLFSFLVFIAYIYQIIGLNTSTGITPDIRYLSPAYLSMNIVGLIILKKIPDLSEVPCNLIKIMLSLGLLLIPIVLIFTIHYYPYTGQESWSFIFVPLNTIVSIETYILIAIFLIMHLSSLLLKKQFNFWKPFVISAILCTPFVWQVAASFIMRLWGSGMGGYTFWIPIVRLLL